MWPPPSPADRLPGPQSASGASPRDGSRGSLPPKPSYGPRREPGGSPDGAERPRTGAWYAPERPAPPVPPYPAGDGNGGRPRGPAPDTPGGRDTDTYAGPAGGGASLPRRFPLPAFLSGAIRPPARPVTIAACVVLGLGLLGGAAAGSWLTGDGDTASAAGGGFSEARSLWHNLPVDEIFPRNLNGGGAGPGGADRTWTRIAVAPDSGCAAAFDPLLAKALSPAGCKRLLRATYVDATTSSVITVGLLVTKADADGMTDLQERFSRERLGARSDLMPRPYAAEGTAAAGFGDDQRAAWTVRVLTDVPAVVYAVSGFADGREIDEPQPADEATAAESTDAPAQAGLGHDAEGVADRVERGFRKAAADATQEDE